MIRIKPKQHYDYEIELNYLVLESIVSLSQYPRLLDSLETDVVLLGDFCISEVEI